MAHKENRVPILVTPKGTLYATFGTYRVVCSNGLVQTKKTKKR